MTSFLTKLLGRLPIGWLQLVHNRMRLFAAIAGVAFANVLIFLQLGFLGALTGSTVIPYKLMDADMLIYSPETNTIGDAGTIPRQRMFQALSVTGVTSATPVYTAMLQWDRKDGGSSNLRVFGVDPNVDALSIPAIKTFKNRLLLEDIGLIDEGTRGVPKEVFDTIKSGNPVSFEVGGRTLTLEGSFHAGAGFDSDGHLIVSDQTFMRLFRHRKAGAPNYIFVKTNPALPTSIVVEEIRALLPLEDTIVETLAQAAKKDGDYQLTQKPVGIIFGFGVILGIFVGIIIVYQVLSTDVADHLSEYSTFKAIGYKHSFFLGIILEEAIILAILGFIPGIVISLGMYKGAALGTGLPMAMTIFRAISVLLGTIIMCAVSGAVATRRLAAADPADLF